MGKTGTSALQENIFPYLNKIGILNYRSELTDEIAYNLIKRDVLNEASSEKKDYFDKFSNDSIQLISCEAILSLDPHYWERSITNLLCDYGKEAEILVTLRSPKSLIRSIYQQMIRQRQVHCKHIPAPSARHNPHNHQ